MGLRRIVLFAFVLGSTLGVAPADAKIAYETRLPAVLKDAKLRAARNSDDRIETARQEILQKARSGQLDRPSPAKRRREQRLVALAGEVREVLARQEDDRPILVIVEGPDGAGKSSTMTRLARAFTGVKKVGEMHFGAPPKDAEKVHWIKRFMEALPQKGSVMLWDRSYYGRAVYDRHYGFADGELTDETLREIRDFEGLLRDKVRVVKFFLDTPAENLARTIAKREVLAPEKLGATDYLSYRDRRPIKRLFRRAIEETGREIPWHVIDMKERADGRAEMLKILKRELAD